MAHLSCGCYYLIAPANHWESPIRQYFPQVDLDSYTSIVGSTSRTDLTQTFLNPSEKPVDEVRYAFPLYDGVSVVAFTITIGDRVINGQVKEKNQAKVEYLEAKEQGQTVALFEQSFHASDVFTTTIGNVPAKANIVVNITYLGELKHDAQVDGLRFTIPTTIAPRYGGGSWSMRDITLTRKEAMTITVDIQLPEGAAVKAVQSPSHPIAVSVGTISTNLDADPSLSRASASLSLGTTTLDADFILQVVATKLDEPTALLETHPTLPNHRALMATLVPKFDLPLERPEIVFICDRSGSMGNSMAPLIEALQVFLKSLPVGVKFNICSFGSTHNFLWSKSKTYDQTTLAHAVKQVSTFTANMGGTEMYNPIKETFKQRHKDMNLEVFLLTDGEIWDQERLFDLINAEVESSKGAVRVFSLGIGSGQDGASSSLVEGIARAGNGFAQMVSVNEKLDKKIVRMLKASLFPHINDYSLEIKYGPVGNPPAYDEKSRAEDDDFVLVEKLSDALTLPPKGVVDDKENDKEHTEKRLISLFDSNLKTDDDTKSDTKSKFDHLPPVPPPRYLQTPHKIPSLFSFSRTSVYVLLSDSTPHQVPTSVLVKATCAHGPLELEIPVTVVPGKATTIHQLAARQEVKDLEEGRGWLAFAKNHRGTLLKSKYPGRFDDMVECEAVRLGVEYQIVGKWTSFIAVDSDGPTVENASQGPKVVGPNAYQTSADIMKGNCHYACKAKAATPPIFSFMRSRGQPSPPALPRSAAWFSAARRSSRGGAPAPPGATVQAFGAPAAYQADYGAAECSPVIALYGAPASSSSSGATAYGSVPPPSSDGVYPSLGYNSASASPSPPPPGRSSSQGMPNPIQPTIERREKLDVLQDEVDKLASSASEFRRSAEALARESNQQNSSLFGDFRSKASNFGGLRRSSSKKDKRTGTAIASSLASSSPPSAPPSSAPPPLVPKGSKLSQLASLQSFDGSWEWSAPLESVLGLSASEAVSKAVLPDDIRQLAEFSHVLATACVIAYFKKKLAQDEEAWELMVDKALDWVGAQVGAKAGDVMTAAEALF